MDIQFKKRPDTPVFKGFIAAMYFLGKDQAYIIDRLKSFGYKCQPEDVMSVLTQTRSVASENMSLRLSKQETLDVDSDTDAQWMREFGVYELIHFMVHKDDKDPPPFHNWVRDVVWINSNDDVQSVVNALIFNNDDVAEIAAVVEFKYRRPITQSAIEIHKKVFFSPVGIDARGVMWYCQRMANHHVILRKIEGCSEIESIAQDSERNNEIGHDFAFNDSNYIKWKLGYKKIKLPSASEFLENVMADAMYKFQETMHMQSFVDTTYVEGISPVNGQSFDQTTKSKKNVEKERAKLATQYLSMFCKAQASKPAESSGKTQVLIEKLTHHQLKFDSPEEHIVSIMDAKNILDDIRGDINNYSGGASVGGDGKND